MRKSWTTTLTTRLYGMLALAALAITPAFVSAANSVSPTNDTFTLGTTNDVLLVLAPDNGTFSSLTSDGTPSVLTNNTHYTVSGTTNFLIKASYLNAQTGATVNLTFVMTNGVDPTAEITIAAGNATVTPTTGSHTLGSTNTLAIALTPNGQSFTKISDPSGDLIGGGTNYTVNGSTYTILSSYLNAQAVTNVPLTFVMGGGISPTTTVAFAAGNASITPTNATYTLGSTNTLTVALTANGRTLSAIKRGATTISTNDYAVSGSDYTFSAAYLNTLTASTNVLTFDMNVGTDPTLSIVVSAGSATVTPTEVPHTLGDTNTVAITMTRNGRSVTNLVVGSSSLATPADYTVSTNFVYTLKASYLNALSTGTNTLVFQMNGGTNPETDLVISAGNATASPTNAPHTLGNTTNTVSITVTPNGRSVTNLLVGSESLATPADYTVTNNIYTIKTAYLNTLSVGTNVLAFEMDEGSDPEVALAIAAGNATVSPSSGNYSLGSTNTLTFTITNNGREFKFINNGTTNLTLGTHYTADGNVFTILPLYLNARVLGPHPLTFDMDEGTDPVATANIQAGNSTVSPASYNHALASTNDRTFTLTLNGRTLSGVKNGATVLQTPAHYTVSGGTNVTIKASYINALAAGSTVTFTFDVNGGTDPTANVVIGTGDPSVNVTTHDYALGSGQDLLVTITPRGTTFVALKTNDVALASPADYVINGNVCTVKADYFEQYPTGTVIALEFDMSAGVSPTTTVTIVAGDASVSPVTASYERGSNVDVDIELTLNGREFENILIGTNVLAAAGGTNYTVSGNTYTIKSAYLEDQSGAVPLTFSMNEGENPVATITVSLSTDASLLSVLTETDSNPNGGDGTATDSAIVWDVDLDNSIDTLARSNIVVATHSTFTVTTNSNFTSNLLGAEDSLALTVGQNIVYIKVTADDEATAKYYTVELWRAASDDTALVSILELSTTNTLAGAGTLASPYTAAISVGYYTNSIATNDIVVANLASFRFYTNATYSSFDELTGTNTMTLAQGVANPVYVKVIAQDNATVTYYNVAVTRTAGDNTATLNSVLGLAPGGSGQAGTVGDPFDRAITVAYSVTNLTESTNDIVIAGLDATFKLYSDDGFVTNVTSLALVQGVNHAFIKLTPQNTSTNYYYDLAITRSAASDDAGLETVLLKAIEPTAGDGSDIASRYVADIEVLYAVTNLTLSDIVASNAPYSTVNLYSAVDFTSDADADIAIPHDSEVEAFIRVTSESGSVTNYYEINITNLPPVTDANLLKVLGKDTGSGVTAGGGAGTNAATRITWTFNTPFLTNTLTSADVAVDDLATFTLTSNPDFTSGVTTSIALTENATNRVYILVTAEDVTTNKYYEAVIFRERGNTNAALTTVRGEEDSNPILQDGTTTNTPILWGQRVNGTPLQVAYAMDSVGTNDIIIGETTLSSFELYSDPSFTNEITTNSIPLAAGVATNVYIKITPQSEIEPRSRFYDVRIKRDAGDKDADLDSVLGETSTETGAGTFAAPYLWAISVSNNVATIGTNDIALVATTSTAKLYSQAFIQASEVTTGTIPLLVPTTVVYVKVTAMDPEVEQFYAITVSRAPSADAGLTQVLSQTPTFSGAGTSEGSPKTGAITIPYNTTTVGTNAIVSADESVFALYSDSDFQEQVTTGTIDIGLDPTTIYVKVTAEDGTTIRFYAVTLTRAGGLEVTPASLAYTTIPGFNPPTQAITILNNGTNGAISVTNVITRSANSGANEWFSLGTNVFNLAAGDSVTATGSINVTNLAVGTYTATNTFTDAANIPWQTVVTLDITAAADNEIFFSGETQDYTGTNIAIGVTSRSGSTNIVVTYDGSNSLPVNVGSYAVTASVATVGNWFATTNTTTLEIVAATQVITFEGTNAVYDGTAKAVTATPLLGTNAVTITYNGSSAAPTNAGTYAVTGTVVAGHSWLAGTNTTTLTIEKAPQTIVEFSLPTSAQMTELIPLSGSVSPAASPATVTYAIVGSGPGSIDSGNNLTFSGGGSVTVRASAAATDNYLAATSVDATVEVIDFAADVVSESFGSAHNGLHSLKFSPDGDLYMFYSATNGAMSVSKQLAGEEAFGTPALVGATSGNYLMRSPMDMLFGDSTNIVGQSGTWGLLAGMTNGTVASFTNTASFGLRNSRFLAGTAPTNFLFVNRGTSIASPRVIAYMTTNNWVTSTSRDIGPGVLTGAAREGDTIAVFTSAGVLLSANAGTTYASAGTPAGAMARGGDRAWYAVNLRTVNQATYMDVSSNRKLISEAGWSNQWSLVYTHETANDTVSHPRLTAYENIAILSWQQGDTGKLMYTVTQNHGSDWTDVKELVSAPTFVRQSSLEAGYDVAVHKDDDGVRFVAAAGLNYADVDLSGITLRATALQTNVYLRWTQPTSLGAPSDEVLIRYLASTNAYPTLSLGTTLYQGSAQLAIHESVIQHQTYMYQLWVRSGASFVDPAAFSAGKEISTFEWNYALPSASLSPASADYVKNSGVAPAFTVTFNGRSVTNVTSTGTGTLTPVLSGNVYTIPESYLTNQTAGASITVTFEMDGGNDLSATIAVFDNATVDPAAPEFEFGSSSNLAITLTPNGRTLESIMNGVATLTVTNDYTVSGNTITILASYLNAQGLGETTLDFVMDGGTNPQSVITVVGGATVSPTKYRHTQGATGNLAITMTARGRTLSAISNQTASAVLAAPADYTVVSSNASYSILADYLNALDADTTLTYLMSDGVNPQTEIKLISGDTEVAEVSGSHTLGTTNTVTLTLDLNGRTFDALTDGTKVLALATDYTKSVTAGVLTVILTKDYLNANEPGTVDLVFNMNAGTDPEAEVTILPGTASITALDGGSHILGAGGVERYELTRNGRSLLDLKRGTTNLVVGVDYTVNNADPMVPVYTVSTNYLNTLPVGTHTLTFDMISGADFNVQIVVTAGTATVSPAAATYPNAGGGGVRTFSLTLNGRTLSSISDGVDNLTTPAEYTVNNTNPLVPVITLLQAYLDTLTDSTAYTITFTMSGGAPQAVTLTTVP